LKAKTSLNCFDFLVLKTGKLEIGLQTVFKFSKTKKQFLKTKSNRPLFSLYLPFWGAFEKSVRYPIFILASFF
jgi:hypothetical protein